MSLFLPKKINIFFLYISLLWGGAQQGWAYFFSFLFFGSSIQHPTPWLTANAPKALAMENTKVVTTLRKKSICLNVFN